MLLPSPGPPAPDPGRSNHFIYRKGIRAAYTNFSTGLGEKWHLPAGLQAEQTRGRGHLVNKGSTNTRHYLNFFPSVFLTQQISPAYQLTYNYSRRITGSAKARLSKPKVAPTAWKR